MGTDVTGTLNGEKPLLAPEPTFFRGTIQQNEVPAGYQHSKLLSQTRIVNAWGKSFG